jgi:hypothetical protein
MTESLATYLQDHLAGASHAIDLLHWLREEHKHDSLGEFTARLVVEIEEDRDVLRRLAEQAGSGSSTVKEMTAHVSERISRLKLSDHGRITLGTFESLEFLVLGIHGKQALWRVMAVLADTDVRLKGPDFSELATKAEGQERKVEARRLELAETVFRQVG